MEYKFQNYEKPQILKNHLKLGGANPSGERIDVTSLYFTRDENPWIGIMGEFHFSRCARKDWYRELCKMKAGGITLVSTYLFWIYHEEVEGQYNFSGDNDIRAFILECKRAGLEVVIRIGPWAHGECRNGGWPDWLLKKPYKIRDNNKEYLDEVRRWYGKIYEQVQGLFYKDGGNIVAVQLENEFCSSAEHLAKLKEIAIECGIIAPIYTVTGWNSAAGAKIPVDEVVPVFGGYCDAPWDHGTKKLPPSPHYFFGRMRNDSAIGNDLIPVTVKDDWQLPYERYPFATCELGGGLENTHHRRYIIQGIDIYAVSLIKLGVGNNLIGYYMYHGGTNQLGIHSTFQESKATGYPNDYPILSYDFQAPISEYGEIREHYRLLNLLHLFVQDFEQELAPMTAVDAVQTVKREDTETLRYCMRTDGTRGYVFVNHYQRLSKLKDITNVVLDTGSIKFPSIDVSGDICFFFPFQMDLSGELLTCATAQPICRQGNTYFFVQIPGIPAEYHFGSRSFRPEPGLTSKIQIGDATIVTLTWEQARYLRKLENEIYIGNGCDLYLSEGEVSSVQEGDYSYEYWNGTVFENVHKEQHYTEPVLHSEEINEAPFEPAYMEELQIGGERKVTWKKLTVSGMQGFVEIEYVGDAAQIYANGVLIADSYYYGTPWRIPSKLLCGKECYLAVSEMRDDFYREF